MKTEARKGTTNQVQNSSPQDQEWLDQPEIDRMNYGADFQGHHLHNGFDSKACCSLNGRHWKGNESVSMTQTS